MKTFEELREELIFMNKRDINMNSPIKQIALLKAKSKNDLLRIITSNWYFVFEGLGDFNSSYFEDNFTEEELREACIYTKKRTCGKLYSFRLRMCQYQSLRFSRSIRLRIRQDQSL